jgi:ABC-type Fe3+/spermidine/putrescine transport system ATPase subunit
VALARALVMKPEVLLLDEPLSNLDAKLRVSIRTELVGIQKELRLTMVYVTHDQEEALAMSDWIAVMQEGKIEQVGTPWEIYYRPRTSFLADFLGAVNLLDARVTNVSTEQATVNLDGVSLNVSSSGTALREGQEVRVSLRPESIAMRDAPGGDPRLTWIQGQVFDCSFFGPIMRYRVQVAGHRWVVDQPDPGAGIVFDGQVYLGLDSARVHIIQD